MRDVVESRIRGFAKQVIIENILRHGGLLKWERGMINEVEVFEEGICRTRDSANLSLLWARLKAASPWTYIGVCASDDTYTATVHH